MILLVQEIVPRPGMSEARDGRMLPQAVNELLHALAYGSMILLGTRGSSIELAAVVDGTCMTPRRCRFATICADTHAGTVCCGQQWCYHG